jgi:hypothetical protein
VVTQPRGFYTKPTATGRTDKSFFDKPSRIGVDCPYEPSKWQMRPFDPKPQIALHDAAKFKPVKAAREKLYVAPYEHKSDRVEFKKQIKDEDGHVITQPRNFYSNPGKRGKTAKGSCFMPFPEFVPCDFDWPRKLRRKEMEKLKASLPDDVKPFSHRCKTTDVF